MPDHESDYELMDPPTWETAAFIYVNCIRHGNSEEAKDAAAEELMRLARLFDKLQATREAREAREE